MTSAQLAALAILFGALGLFLSGRLRHDVVALFALAAVGATELVPRDEIFDGFGHPATLTVMLVLIISVALNRAGVVDLAARRLAPYTEGELQHILVLTGAVAVLSAFMNNVGALALMMPVALATAQKHDRNPAFLLMPLAFAAILGGMTTLIGTPPNIIVASIREQHLGAPFALFDFAPVGVAVALFGVLFVALVGWRLLPEGRRSTNAQRRIFTLGEYTAEVRVTDDSPLAGKPLREATEIYEQGARVFGVERRHGEDAPSVRLPAVGYRMLARGDILLLRAAPEALASILNAYRLELVSEAKERALSFDREFDWKDAALLEAVVSPTSSLVGRSARLLDRMSGGAASLVALAREGEPIRGRLRQETFQAGDVALLQGEAGALDEMVQRFQLWPLAERGLSFSSTGQPLAALGIFVAALLLAAVGALSIGVAFVIAILAYIVFGMLPVRELYDGVDWTVIVLLGAMFPLGAALENSGTTALIADSIVNGANAVGLPAWGVVGVLLVATMFLSDVINNAATALLMAPLGIKMAESFGEDTNADPFLMAVAVGASCAFLTPIGHQCNTLVMGPGGYKFGDYWRMGLPLEGIIVAVALPLILLFWPL